MGFLSWLTRSSLKVGAVAAAVKISIDNGKPIFRFVILILFDF